MTYTFRLFFSGLCAFVPDSDLGAPPRLMTVLLLNTDQGRFQTLNNPPERHLPILKFNLKNLYNEEGTGKFLGVWPLNFEDIRIYLRDRETGEEVSWGPLRIVSDQSRESFTLLPLMEDLLPSAGQVDPDYLRLKLVKARVFLDTGTLKVAQIAQYQGKDVRVHFVPNLDDPDDPQPIYSKLLPHKIMLELSDLPENLDVVIYSEGFEGDPLPTRELVLKPIVDPTGRSIIEVSILNLCCDSVLGEPLQTERVPEADTDFEAFYGICKELDNLMRDYRRFPIPVPVIHDNDGEKGGGGDTIKCTGARFLASSEESSDSDDEKEGDTTKR